MKHLFIVLFLLPFFLSAQMREHYINGKASYSVNSCKLLANERGKHYVHVISHRYNDTTLSQGVHGIPFPRYELWEVDNEMGGIRDSVEVPRTDYYGQMNLSRVANGHFVGAGYLSNCYANVIGPKPWNNLVVGIQDTNDFPGSSPNPVFFTDTACDLVTMGVRSLLFNDGHYYVLYDKGYNEGMGLTKLNESLSLVSKISIDEKFGLVQVKPDNSGFYVLSRNPSNSYEVRLAELDLTGTVTHIMPYISHPEGKMFNGFYFNGEALFMYPTGNSEYSDVRKYDLNGNLLGVYDSGFRTMNVFGAYGGLLVVQRAVNWLGDANPLKIALLDYDFNNVLAEKEYGEENLYMTDFRFNPDNGEFSGIGITRNDGRDTAVRTADKLYFIIGTIDDLLAEGRSAGDSGQFYPNPGQPSTTYLRLANQLDEVTEVVFYTVSGAQVSVPFTKSSPGLYALDSSKLENGVYMAVATGEGKALVSELVVVQK